MLEVEIVKMDGGLVLSDDVYPLGQCPDCGADMPIGYNYCPFCGSKMERN